MAAPLCQNRRADASAAAPPAGFTPRRKTRHKQLQQSPLCRCQRKLKGPWAAFCGALSGGGQRRTRPRISRWIGSPASGYKDAHRCVSSSPAPSRQTPRPPTAGQFSSGPSYRAMGEHAEISVLSLSGADDGPEIPAMPWLARHEVVQHHHLSQLHGPGRVRHKLRMLAAWRHRPLLAAKFWSPAFARSLQRLIRNAQAEVVLVEFAMMAQYLPFTSGVPSVLTDHEDGEPRPIPIGPCGLGRRRDRALWTRYVREYYRRATLLQTLNQPDADTLAGLTGRPVEVRPAARGGTTRRRRPRRRPTTRAVPRQLRAPAQPTRRRWCSPARCGPRCDGAVRRRSCGSPAPAPPAQSANSQASTASRSSARRTTSPRCSARFGCCWRRSSPGAACGSRSSRRWHTACRSCRTSSAGAASPPPTRSRWVPRRPTRWPTRSPGLLEDPTAAATTGLTARQWVDSHAAPEALAATQLERLQRLVDAQ